MQEERVQEEFDEEMEDEESDADDFIVDDDGRPITEKKKKVTTIGNSNFDQYIKCASL